VTITARSCVRASRLTSTALRRVTSSSRSASALLASARQRERLAGERRPCSPDRVQHVVFAAQPPLGSWCAAELKHRLATTGKETGKAGAVTAGPLDRPGAAAGRVPLSEAKQLAIAAGARRGRAASNDSARRRRHHRHHVLVAVSVDAEHVVQHFCKHQTRSSDHVRRVRWCRSEQGKPRRQACDESRH